MLKKILIIADIEGSSGCSDYNASSFNTRAWYDACIDMSLDLDAVVTALFNGGAEKVYIKDFHRTGYNILPELIDKRAVVIHGYKAGSVPGIGDVYDAEAVMFIGMHSSSGSGGFLAHTLTSRYSSITVNGRRVSELQLFASSLYRYSLRPVFFSGCPVACSEAVEDIQFITTFSVKKDALGRIDKDFFRKELSDAAAGSLANDRAVPYLMQPPFEVKLFMRDGSDPAEKVSGRWGVSSSDNIVSFNSESFDDFYGKLIRITYFSPFLEKFLPVALTLVNLYGKLGLLLVRFHKYSIITGLKRRRLGKTRDRGSEHNIHKHGSEQRN